LSAQTQFDAVIVGAGPAGSAAAITAARAGMRVLLLERGGYPRHKVCGEFVSREALGALRQLLGNSLLLQDAVEITRAVAYIGRRELRAQVTPPALSIARYELDHALWLAAQSAGVECRPHAEVQKVEDRGQTFHVRLTSETFSARAAINAAGRWSKLQTSARNSATRWLGLKAHFAESGAAAGALAGSNAVELFFLPFGYCGVQPVISQGERRWNVCCMVRAGSASQMSDVLAAHPVLRARAALWRQAMEPVSTAPLLFRTPTPLDANGMLAAGDAAAFIDPFVGDGIAIALRSGIKAGELIAQRDLAWSEISEHYSQWYRQAIVPALRNAGRLRRFISLPRKLQAPLVSLANVFGAGEWLVRATRSRG
jgi:flavin-dependent dehydrogenase